MDPRERRLLGYSEEICVAAGESVHFKVSSPGGAPYHADLVRLRCADSHPHGPGFKERLVAAPFAGEHPGLDQPYPIGSYVHVPGGGELLAGSFSLTLLIWPTTPGGREQALFGCWDPARACGVGLVLDEAGCPALLLGDGGHCQRISTGAALLSRHWYRLTVTLSRDEKRVGIVQEPLFEYAAGAQSVRREAPLETAAAAGGNLSMAAWLDGGLPAAAFNGKLEAPEVRDGAGQVLAAWDFSREIGSARVVDVAGGHDGRTVNLPARAVCGAAWDGTEHDFRSAPDHYGAIHFHEDDLSDCCWQTSFEYRVPEDLPCSVYAARLTSEAGTEYLPFYVRPPRNRPRARLALLIPMASYCAYANQRGMLEWAFAEQLMNGFTVLDDVAQYLHYHPELGISTYDCHTDGSGGCYSSRLRPMVNMRPNTWAWQFVADTHLTDWLDELGFEYDVFTDEELHAEGVDLLAPYTCVMTGTHPEYYSRAMLEAVLGYQQRGGRLMYMGANGFYWKIDYHPDYPGVIEMRRAEDGSRGWLAEPGEYRHGFTGELGGLWRRSGIPPQKVCGVGFTAQGFDSCSHFERTEDSFDARAAFIFEGIGADEVIGDFGATGGAAGLEIDRADPLLGTPPHALVVASATQFSAGYHWVKEEFYHAHAAITGETCPYVRADVVFYETPNGGAVFSTGSIAWAGALAHNGYENNVSRITANVLRRFLDPAPFAIGAARES